MKMLKKLVLAVVCVFTLVSASMISAKAEETVTYKNATLEILENAPASTETGVYQKWVYRLNHSTESLKKEGTDTLYVTIRNQTGQVLFEKTKNPEQGKSYYDYTVEWMTVNPGKYTVTARVETTINGIKKAVSTKQFTLTYTEKTSTAVAKTNIRSITRSKTYMTVKWKKNTKVNGYEIRYGKKADSSDATTITISKNRTTSKKIRNLSRKTKYYVQLRSYKYIDGMKVYSSWSSRKSVKTK